MMLSAVVNGGRFSCKRFPANFRHRLFDLYRILAAKLTNGARVNINSDAAHHCRLALHDGAAAELRFEINAVRQHPHDDGLTRPGRGVGSEICVAHLELACVFNDAHTTDYRI